MEGGNWNGGPLKWRLRQEGTEGKLCELKVPGGRTIGVWY